ncbi:WD40 repeat-like protein [Suillus hirtellus]|nr:WD40 repeat-like protein [Suillus hirtellus]
MTPRQEFKGHTETVRGVIHMPGGQRIITCSDDGSLRVWNLKTGNQIGEDWRDGEGAVCRIALSQDGKKVVSGSSDGAVRLWDIDTCKVIAKWMGHTKSVLSVCWSRDSRRVLSGSEDGTARQWDVESGETILERIETGHTVVGLRHAFERLNLEDVLDVLRHRCGSGCGSNSRAPTLQRLVTLDRHQWKVALKHCQPTVWAEL